MNGHGIQTRTQQAYFVACPNRDSFGFLHIHIYGRRSRAGEKNRRLLLREINFDLIRMESIDDFQKWKCVNFATEEFERDSHHGYHFIISLSRDDKNLSIVNACFINYERMRSFSAMIFQGEVLEYGIRIIMLARKYWKSTRLCSDL